MQIQQMIAVTDTRLVGSQYGPKFELVLEGDTIDFSQAMKRTDWETTHYDQTEDGWQITPTIESFEEVESKTGLNIFDELEELKLSIENGSLFIKHESGPEVVIELLKEPLSFSEEYWDDNAKELKTYSKDLIEELDDGTKAIPIGLNRKTQNSLDDWGVKYSIEDGRVHPDWGQVGYKWNFQYDLRGYQEDALFRALQGSCVIQLPTGAGKTVVGLRIIKEMGLNALVLVHKTEILDQWKQSIQQNLGVDPGIVREERQEFKNISVAMIQTLNNSDFEIDKYDVLLTDECFTGETAVETRDGRTTFDELDDEHGFDYGWNDGIDFQVKTYNTDTNTYEYDTVNEFYKGKSIVEEITTEDGHTLRSTPSHKHKVLNTETGEVDEKRGIREGEYLVKPMKGDINFDIGASHPIAELHGWVIGDGSVNKNRYIKFGFSENPEEQIEILKNLCEKADIHYTNSDSNGFHGLRSGEIADVIDWKQGTGAKANTVTVPPEAYNWEPERQAALLRGLYDSEGWIDESERIFFSSSSEKLADDVECLLQKLGIPSKRTQREREKEEHSTQYRVTVSTFYKSRFERMVGFRMTHKQQYNGDGGSPGKGIGFGGFLGEIKDELNLTGEELGNMAGLSRAVMNDIIIGKENFAQHRIPTLADSLREYADKDVENIQTDVIKEELDIPYSEIGEEIGYSLTHTHLLHNDGDERVDEGIVTIARERLNQAEEFAAKLDKLTGLHFHEVRSVEEDGFEDVYDFETGTHEFIAGGFLSKNCHHIPADTFYDVAMRVNAFYRYGLSATASDMFRETDDGIRITAGIGPTGLELDAQYLIDNGYLAEPEFEWLYPPEITDDFEDYHEAYKQGIEFNFARNKMIAKRAFNFLEDNRRVLIDVKRLDHGRSILSQFPDGMRREWFDPETDSEDDYSFTLPFSARRQDSPVPIVHNGSSVKGYDTDGKMIRAIDQAVRNSENAVFWVHGEDKDEIRKYLIDLFSSGTVECIISTLLREGVDVPELDTVILAGGGKSATQLIQTVGRALRPQTPDAVVVDIADKTKYLGEHTEQRAVYMDKYYGSYFTAEDYPNGVSQPQRGPEESSNAD